jgi:hypothetical protein
VEVLSSSEEDDDDDIQEVEVLPKFSPKPSSYKPSSKPSPNPASKSAAAGNKTTIGSAGTILSCQMKNNF